MRYLRNAITALVLVTSTAGTAWGVGARQQNMTEQQRRELEKKLSQLEDQMQDLRRQLGQADGNTRVRVQAGPPRAFTIAPRLTMMRRPKFGFSMDQVPDSAGARVTAVTPGSPAERSGLRSGDVVTLFNGVKLGGLDDPASEVMRQGENIEVGDTITVEFKHDKDRKRVQMVAENLPGAFAYSFSDEPGSGMVTPQPGGSGFRMDMPEVFELGRIPGTWLDIEMASVNKDLGEYFGVAEGVLVVRAPRDSSLGLRGGDVILSIGGRKATSPSQAMRVLRSYDRGESFDILVLRQKKKVTVSAKVPDRDRGYFWRETN